MVKVSASVLALDYSKFNEQCTQLNASSAEWCHFDVMDGHFVPNLTFGPDILKGFKKACPDMFMDVHLMVTDPGYFAKVFKEAGADLVSFHVEVFESENLIHELLKEIRDMGIKNGLVIKPDTDVSVLDPFIEECDLILVMSVEPGFGGQKFMPEALEKVKYLRTKIDEKKAKCLIEIDGGVNADNFKTIKQAGVDVLVAGSYVFKGDIAKNTDYLIQGE